MWGRTRWSSELIRFRLKRLLLAMTVVALTCTSLLWFFNGPKWLATAELASHLKRIDEIESFRIDGFQDGPFDFTVAEITIALQGEPSRRLAIGPVSSDLQSHIELQKIGKHRLWVSTVGPGGTGHPDVGERGVFFDKCGARLGSIQSVVQNYDAIQDEVRNWPDYQSPSTVKGNGATLEYYKDDDAAYIYGGVFGIAGRQRPDR